MKTEYQPVDEFRDNATFTPSDPIEWPVHREYKEFLADQGFRLTQSLGDAALGDRVAADIFWQAATGHALIRLVVLGMPTWIVCNTRSAFVRFGLWLSHPTM